MSSFWEFYKSSYIFRFFKMGSSLNNFLNFNLFWFCFKFCMNQCFNTIIHVLDKIFLGTTKSSLIRNVENTGVWLRVFTMDTTDLNVVFISNFLEFRHIFGEFHKLNVNWSSHGCSAIGWTWGNVTKMVIMSELDNLLDISSTSWKSFENSSDISTWLHGNNSELIFFVNPN